MSNQNTTPITVPKDDILWATGQVNKKPLRQIPNKTQVVAPPAPIEPLSLPTSPDDMWNNKFWSQLKGIPNANEFITSRNSNIAKGITSKIPNIRDLNDLQLTHAIQDDLRERGASIEDPEVAKNIHNTVRNIRQQIRAENPQYTSDDYYKRLIAWQQLDDTTNYGAKQAMSRFQNVNKYKSMNEVWLVDAINRGELIPWSQSRNDLSNLGMGNALQTAQSQAKFNNTMRIKKYLTDGIRTDKTKSLSSQSKEVPDTTTNHLSNIAKKVIGDMPDDQLQEFHRTLSDDEQIIQQSRKVSEITKEEVKLKIAMQRLRDDALGMSIQSGTGGLESGYLDAYVSEKSKPLIWRMEALASDKAAESNILSTLIQNRQFNFDKEWKQKAFDRGIYEYNQDYKLKEKALNNTITNDERDYQLKLAEQNNKNRQKTEDWNFVNLITNEVKSPSQMYAMQWDTQSMDFASDSNIINRYPNEASLKNNNPAWIKIAITDRTKQLLANAGLSRALWSKPPSNEWWQYMKFANVADWLLAHKTLLTKAWSDDIYSRLMQRVGTKNWPQYASQLMSASGIAKGTKFSQLNDNQLNTLIMNQIKRESPWFYNELNRRISSSSQNTQWRTPSLSSWAGAIINWYWTIKDVPMESRIKVAKELSDYFDSIKSSYKDPNEFNIRKSTIYTSIPSEADNQKLQSISNVSSQLDRLKKSLDWSDTWPLRELREKSADKWTNQDTVKIRQEMEALLPDLARWVFWEKWVLTDSDIERYRKTIPNQWNKKDVNAAIVNNLREILAQSFQNTVKTLAKSNKNVANWADDYVAIRDNSPSWLFNALLNNTKLQSNESDIDSFAKKYGL